MDLVRDEFLCSGNISSPQGTGGIGGPVVLETLAMDLEKSHPSEDLGFPLASPSTATDDEISSSTMGPPLVN